MTEIKLRRIHRQVGITIAFFIVIQAATGIFFSGHHLLDSWGKGHSTTEADPEAQHGHHKGGFEKLAEYMHHRGGAAADFYRILLGTATIFMAISGTNIFMATRRKR